MKNDTNVNSLPAFSEKIAPIQGESEGNIGSVWSLSTNHVQKENSFILSDVSGNRKETFHQREIIDKLKSLRTKGSLMESSLDQGWAWATKNYELISRMAEVGQPVCTTDLELIMSACKLIAVSVKHREYEQIKLQYESEAVIASAIRITK